MYVLYAESKADLAEKTRMFEQYMEPILAQLESFYRQGHVPAHFTEIPQYLQVCRWPFRKLEYSFVLDALLDFLTPHSCYLDAGSGVTPLVQVFVSRGIQAEACDGNEQLIENLNRLDTQRIYGTLVKYTSQNLTKTSYPDAAFDAISCVSVLEHIPAPYDQAAVKELLRILKLGGLLVLTLDFTPPSVFGNRSKLDYYLRRTVNLARQGNFAEIRRGFSRKLEARRVIKQGAAQNARSTN